MNSFVQGLFKAFSYLPWFVFYGLSNVAYIILYYVAGYRRKVVMDNLKQAFPEKTEAARILIAKQCYRNICDTFMETLKLISISEKALCQRVELENGDLLADLLSRGKTINLIAGHFLNFEMGNLATMLLVRPYSFIGVYMPLKSFVFEKIIFDMRSRFGTIMLPATRFRESFQPYEDKQHVLGLVGDQSTGNLHNAYWMSFFGKVTPFAKGPYTGSHKRNTALVLFSIHHLRRGYYKMHFQLLTESAGNTHPHTLALQTRDWLEETIRRYPADYLWTHRRWKRSFDPAEFGHLLVS